DAVLADENNDISLYAPDEGSGTINLINGPVVTGFVQGQDGSGSATNSNGWNDGAGSAAWVISFSTDGLDDIKLSSWHRGSNTGPRDFQAQYSLNGTDWTDIPGGDLAVVNSTAGAVLDNLQLPAAVENQPTVYVRWVMTSETSVNGGTVAGGGTNRLDNVLVTSGELPDAPILDVADLAELRTQEADGETRYRVTGEVIVHFRDSFQGRRMLVDDSGAGMWSVDLGAALAEGQTIGDGITGLVGVLTLQNNDALLRFELDEESGDAIVTSTGNEVDPELFTFDTISLDDTGKLALFEGVTFQDSGTFSTGTNYTIEDGDGGTFTFRTDFFDADYIGDEIPQGEIDIVGYVGGFGSNAQITARSSEDLITTDTALSANLQIVHNSPDPAVEEVDIYINGDLSFEGVPFRSATAFEAVPAGVELSIEIAPANAGIENALPAIPVTLNEGVNYIAVASGVVETADFTGAEGFSLELFSGGKLEADDPTTVELNIQHGSPDAPAIDIFFTQTGETAAAAGLEFPDFTGYLPLSPEVERIGIAPAGGEVFAEFFANLTEETGNAWLVLASGFLSEENAGESNSFALLAVSPQGETIVLDLITTLTIAEARALPEGEVVEIVGVVNSNDFGFTVADYFVQDNTAGINITDFDQGGNADGPVVAPGDSVRIFGEIDLFNNQVALIVESFEILNTGNPVPEPLTITGPDFTDDSEFQGRRVQISDVRLLAEDVAAWPTTPITSGSGINVRFETIDRDTIIVRLARNNSYIGENGAPVPQGWVNVTGSLGQFRDDTQLFPFFEGDIEEQPTVAQIIHNSADPAVASVDIFIDGDLAFPGVDFRDATSFVELPSEQLVQVVISPAGAGIESGVSSNLFLDPGERYYLIASGVLDDTAFLSNPDGEDTGFQLRVIPEARLSVPDDEVFSFRIHHGSTDAPTVNIAAQGVATLATDVTYGATTPDFINVPAQQYIIELERSSDEVLIGEFDADATALGGQAAVILASGFNTASAGNQNGEGFNLLVVLADGTTLVLPPSVFTSVDDSGLMPQAFELKQNYPNPFNPTTNIPYNLPQASNVRIEVYNVLGQRVATLVDLQQQAAGSHTFTFDASNLASGVYLYRIQAGNFVQTRKLTLIK
ncbi:MAG: DUF4397 domain-containing protein, partial [Balneolaceae bacterium]